MTSVAAFLAGMVSGAVLVWGYFAVRYARPARPARPRPVKPGTPVVTVEIGRHRPPVRNEWNDHDDGRTSFTVPPAPDDATAFIIRNEPGRYA